MNTIENLLSPAIKHVFPTGNIKHVCPTGILIYGFKSDKSSLHFIFCDESFNFYLHIVKQDDPFVRGHLESDLNRLMLFFENKDNFEFKRSDQGYSLELIKPINLKYSLEYYYENKKKEEADLFRYLLIESKNKVFKLIKKNTSLKKKLTKCSKFNIKFE